MNLKQKIIYNLQPILKGFDIYLFGSILTSDYPNDIDLLIIYNKKIIQIEQAVEYRKKISLTLSKICDIHSEILLLSNEENNELEFVKNIRTEKLP